MLDVGAADHGLALLALPPQAVHQLGAQDVDLAVENAALVGDLLLLLRQLVDEALELLVGESAEIGKGFHGVLEAGGERGREYSLKPSLRVSAASQARRGRRGPWRRATSPGRCRAAPGRPT